VRLSLNPQHLARYRDIAALLVKHRRVPDDPAEAEADARALASELEAMGPTFVKLGQLLSTRPDLLPDVYVRTLAHLQDRVAPVDFSAVEEVVSSELGTNLSRAFSTFEQRPLASASLGQVHRATLRDGRPVAVKVQRPGAEGQVARDMEVIEELAEFADAHTRAGRELGFRAMVDEFRRSLDAELDYRLEARNLHLLGEALAGYERIVVPAPVDAYSTGRVLTMDLVEGRNISSASPLRMMEVDGELLARQLFDAYLDQILVHGLVHADPHPGNVLLTADGRLALVDVGMVARVSRDVQDALVRLLLAISEGDGASVAAVLADLGERRDDWDRPRFHREIVELVRARQGETAGQLEAGRLVGELARAAASAGLRPPPELTLIGKALLNLDQVAATLAPGFRPDEAIADHVASIMRHKMAQTVSPANMLSAAMDAKEFAERLPARVNKVMDALAEGRLTLNVQGIDEMELMRGVQKLANRVTAGVIIAAVIVGAAMMMQIHTSAKLLGYPAVAIVCFLLAAAAGVWLIVNSALHDLPQRRRRRR